MNALLIRIVTLAGVLLASVAWSQQPVRDAGAMTRRVDELIDARLADEGVTAAEPAADSEFLRRAQLDLTGRIPRVSEVRAFLADSRPERRALLIDQLLEKPSHATHLANTWRQFLLPDGADITRFGGGAAFEFWLRQKFAENAPYDAIAREIVLAKGQVNAGPTLFYTALESKPEELAAATSRAFLGVQIQCAQCHDHPHDKWKQEEFWSFAAFFARLQKPAAMQPVALVIADVNEGEVEHPKTKQPIAPRYLAGDEANPDASKTRREQLAAWLTARENPFFAKAAVNRIWAMLFGRGLVDPVDDLGEHNDASHPELLNELADYFVATNYDVRNLIRVLANTEAYQRTSKLRDGETPTSPRLFARMAIKSLTADQLYDCLGVATLKREMPGAMMQQGGFNIDQQRLAFIDKFRGPQGNRLEFHGGIPQALTLMNGGMIDNATHVQSSPLLISLEAPFFSDAQRIETLFLATLSRLPHAEEKQKFLSYLESRLTDDERKRALSDALWALLNSAEFTLNH